MEEQNEVGKPLVSNIVVAIRKENNFGEIVDQYPNELGEDERILAKYMIPKGESKSFDFTLFYLGRKLLTKAPEFEIRRRRTTVAMKDSDPENQLKTIEIFAYTFSEDSDVSGWEMLGSDMLVAYLHPSRIDIIDDSDQSELAIIEPHFDLQYTEMEPLFVAVSLSDGSALGLRFKNEDEEEQFMLMLETMCAQIASKNGISKEEIQKRYTGPTLHCYSAIKGEIALAICSSSQYVHFLKPIIELAVIEYTKSQNTDTLQTIYNSINKIKLPVPKSFSIDLFDQSFSLSIPALNTRDQITSYSLRHLIAVFKSGVMDIFNFVLFDKKIIFLGQRCAAQDVCNCVVAAAMLCAPLIILETRAFPFTSLASKFFKQDSFIAGLDDPNIIQQPENWDLLCNIDSGVISYSPNSSIKKDSPEYQSLSLLDSSFYQHIHKLHKMKVSDQQIQLKFRNYTRRILDLTTNIAYFPNENEKENEEKSQRYRVGLFSLTALAAAYTLTLDSRAIKQKEIYLALQRLVLSTTDINEKDLIGIFNLLQPYTNSAEKIDELTTAIRDYGCTEVLGMAVVHPSEAVKKAAKTFLYNMKLFQNYSVLNPFFRSSYRRMNSASNR